MISYITEIVQSMIVFFKIEHMLNIFKASVPHKDLIAFYFKTTKYLVSLKMIGSLSKTSTLKELY